MPDRPLTGPGFVARRTAVVGTLGGLAATVLAAGCDHGDDIGRPASSGSPSATTTSAGGAEQTPEQTPDEALVLEVVDALGTSLGTLQAARHFPALRPLVAPLAQAHRRHVAVLEGEPDVGASAPVLADPSAALVAVHRSERHLQAALVDAAGRAESGALAKLLASMSASVAQHLALLPAEVGG